MNPPSTVDYYFTARDAYRMASLHQSDVSLNYAKRLGIRKSEVFFRGTIINVFNRDELTNFAGGTPRASARVRSSRASGGTAKASASIPTRIPSA